MTQVNTETAAFAHARSRRPRSQGLGDAYRTQEADGGPDHFERPDD
jgi:hypothetical protein